MDSKKMIYGTVGSGMSFYTEDQIKNYLAICTGKLGRGVEYKSLEGWAEEFCLILPKDFDVSTSEGIMTVKEAVKIFKKLGL